MASATDGFTRADGDLGANWTTEPALGRSLTITSNTVKATGACYQYLNTFTATAAGSIYAQVVQSSAQPNDPGIGVYLADSSSNIYAFRMNWDGSGRLQRNGTYVGSIYSPGSWAASGAGGKALKIQLSGGVVKLFIDGVEILSPGYTDGSPISADHGGLWTVTTENSSYYVDDFEVGDPAGGGSSSVPAILNSYRQRRAA